MITHDEKAVIIIGVDAGGSIAVIHLVDAMGVSRQVPVQDLCSDTLGELETALCEAPVVPVRTAVAPREARYGDGGPATWDPHA